MSDQDRPGGGPDGDGDRLGELERGLRAARKADEGKKPAADRSGVAVAFRLSTELVAGAIVGALVGYGLDYLLGTSPWLFILCFVLGVAGGFLNVARAGIRSEKRNDGNGR